MGDGSGSSSSTWLIVLGGLALGSSMFIGVGRVGDAPAAATSAASPAPAELATALHALTAQPAPSAEQYCRERWLAPLEEAGLLGALEPPPPEAPPPPAKPAAAARTNAVTPSPATTDPLAATGTPASPASPASPDTRRTSDAPSPPAPSDAPSPPAPPSDAPSPPAASLPPVKAETTTSWLEPVRRLAQHAQRPKVIVATLADPIDSGLAYKFDAALQAIRLGVEHPIAVNDGYYRDRAWLPWDDRSVPPAKRVLSESCRRSMPGVLLFRSRSAQPYLLVLLVGETPLRGLHPKAMALALDIATILQDESRVLNIVGPSFSGSAPSLRRAVAEWARRPEAAGVSGVRIRTGAATGSDLQRVLSSETDGWASGKLVDFFATIAPEASVRCAYLNFLHYRLGVASDPAEPPPRRMPRSRWSLPEVAFLRESGTEFGASALDDLGCPTAGVDLSFPVHVSLLRDAYEEMDRQMPRAKEATIARRTSLGVSLRDARQPLDLPEASAKSIFAQDLALSNLLDDIARQNIRHVAIQATDVGDAIFLARKIRDTTPDVRIAFLTSDVLLGHASYRRDLSGSLVVSSYPFLGMSSLGQHEGQGVRRDAFENAAALGIFNAMLVARDAPRSELRDYIFGTSATRLPVWVSAMTGGKLFPISATPSRTSKPTLVGHTPLVKDSECQYPGDPGDDAAAIERKRLFMCKLGVRSGMKMPRVWHFVFGLLCLGAGVDWGLRRRALRRLSSSSLVPPVRDDWQTELALGRTKWRLYAALRSCAMSFPLAYMALIYFVAYNVYGHDAAGGIASRALGLAGVSAVLVLAALAFGLSLWAVVEFGRDFADLYAYFRWDVNRLPEAHAPSREPATASRPLSEALPTPRVETTPPPPASQPRPSSHGSSSQDEPIPSTLRHPRHGGAS